MRGGRTSGASLPASAPFKVYVDTFADVGRLAEGVDADALFDPFLVDEFGNLLIRPGFLKSFVIILLKLIIHLH